MHIHTQQYEEAGHARRKSAVIVLWPTAVPSTDEELVGVTREDIEPIRPSVQVNYQSSFLCHVRGEKHGLFNVQRRHAYKIRKLAT